MSKKTVDDCYKLLNTLTNSKELSYKAIRKIVKKLFIPILNKDGYTIDKESMWRHDYLDYIASKGVGDSKQTMGIAFNPGEKVTTKDFIEELVAGCRIDGIDSLIYVSNAPIESNSKKLDEDLYPVRFQHLDFERLGSWIQGLYEKEEVSAVLKILQESTQRIISSILNDPNMLQDLEWLDMERTVAELFRGLGFKVERTPSSKDGGKDVILELEEAEEKKSYLIEIKHWRSKQKVGKSAVENFVKVVVKEKRTAGLFLSTYGVSSGAVESLTKIEREKVKFGDEEKIISLCESYVKKKESGLWLKNLELEKILFQNTL